MKQLSQVEILKTTRREVHKPTRGFKNKARQQKSDAVERKVKHKGKDQ